MASIHPLRTSPKVHHMKKTTVRAARSAPVSKVPLKGSKAKPSTSKEEIVDTFDDDDEMASSFLQYCAMCEKQIVIPNNSILYCSESCRKRDAHIHDNDPSLSLLHALPPSPAYDVHEPFAFRTRSILPSKLPTPRPLIARIPPVDHDGKSDLDPTEWKPSEGGSVEGKPGGEGKGSAWRPKLPHRPSSEAYGYLSQFHRSAPASTSRSGVPLRSTPSLSHTPTTTASSNDSMAGTPAGVSVESLIPHVGTPLSKSAGVEAAELVTPKLASLGATAHSNTIKDDGTESTLVEDISYDKKWVLKNTSSAAGSLKKLLGHGGVGKTAFAM